MKIAICRIVGNELPPKDEGRAKLKSLEFVIKNEASGENNFWVINRIADKNYLKNIEYLLKDEPTINIPFNKNEYKNAANKLHYITNINAARNLGIKTCLEKYDLVFILDQDIYFTKEQWNHINSNLNNSQYFGVVTKRIHVSDIDKDYREFKNNELMLGFTKNASESFDETIIFGNNDKIELIKRLKSETKIVGMCSHIGFADPKIEYDLGYRLEQRKLSLAQLVADVDNLCKIKL